MTFTLGGTIAGGAGPDKRAVFGRGGVSMVRRRVPVTRDVDPSVVWDLVERPPRAALAFADGDVDAVPVRARWVNGTHLVGVPSGGAPDLAGRTVVLVIDGGPYWFELRGLSVRGVARPAPAPAGESADLVWYALEPRRVLAWDYAHVRDA
jgi:hypothetical protein